MMIAVTGHRPQKLGGYTVQTVLTQYAEYILTLAKKNYGDCTIVTGMAIGWDMAIAQACIDLGLPFHAYVPFRGQEKLWPHRVQVRYQYLLTHAEKVVIVSEGGFSRDKMDLRNKAMVDVADILVSLWDGSSSGTGNCVQYARSKNIKTINVWDGWQSWPKKRT
jgi:uncharacterized phage-like protein YoqJ